MGVDEWYVEIKIDLVLLYMMVQITHKECMKLLLLVFLKSFNKEHPGLRVAQKPSIL